MPRRILDTSVLIQFWRRKGRLPVSENEAEGWASELCDLEDTQWIVTPVSLEFLAGVRSSRELLLARAFIHGFDWIDEGDISRDVWEDAERLASRVPRDGKPRHLGDCPVRAIANSLRCDVVTRDIAFPR